MKCHVFILYLVQTYSESIIAQSFICLISLFSIVFYVMEAYMVTNEEFTMSEYLIIGNVSSV